MLENAKKGKTFFLHSNAKLLIVMITISFPFIASAFIYETLDKCSKIILRRSDKTDLDLDL